MKYRPIYVHKTYTVKILRGFFRLTYFVTRTIVHYGRLWLYECDFNMCARAYYIKAYNDFKVVRVEFGVEKQLKRQLNLTMRTIDCEKSKRTHKYMTQFSKNQRNLKELT